MTSARQRLAACAAPLLDPSATAGERQAAVERLFELCCELTGLGRDGSGLNDAPAQLPEGRALGPLSAARCLLDSRRTVAFLQGLRAAIDVAGARSGAAVDVLYAGCGPFAPLFLPLTTVLPAGAARFTLLDLHEQAAASVRRLAAACGAEPWLAEARAADAFDFEPERPPHVAVVEAMQRALEHEPQAALMSHLAGRLAPGGLLLPEAIELTVALADLGREFGPGAARVRTPLGKLLRLESAALAAGEPLPEARLRVRVPDGAAPGHALVLTHVCVHGPHVLGEYDSGITSPRVLHALGVLDPGCEIEVCWRGGHDPRLEARLVV